MSFDLVSPAPLAPTATAMHDWQACAASWLERKRARSDSTKTATIYERTLAAFFAACPKAPGDVLPQDVLAFATSPSQRDGSDPAKATVNQRLAVVSSFYAYACKFLVMTDGAPRPLATFNPAAAVERSKTQMYGKSKAGKVTDLRKQIAAIPCDVAGLRDKALIVCYLLTGRRLNEIASLHWGDLDIDGKTATMHINRVKGGDSMTLALPSEAWAAIRAYLLADNRWGRMTASDPVFVALRGARTKPLSAQAVWTIIKARLGLHPHQLRHTFAQQLDALGTGIREIQAILGHKSISTTQIYLGKLEATEVPNADGLAAAFLGDAPRKRRRA